MTVSGQFDKGLSRTWSHSSCHKNVSSFHDNYDISDKTQVLDFPLCWALGSGGRGAFWDLSNGTIVSYFGSNDRFYVTFAYILQNIHGNGKIIFYFAAVANVSCCIYNAMYIIHRF